MFHRQHLHYVFLLDWVSVESAGGLKPSFTICSHSDLLGPLGGGVPHSEQLWGSPWLLPAGLQCHHFHVYRAHISHFSARPLGADTRGTCPQGTTTRSARTWHSPRVPPVARLAARLPRQAMPGPYGTAATLHTARDLHGTTVIAPDSSLCPLSADLGRAGLCGHGLHTPGSGMWSMPPGVLVSCLLSVLPVATAQPAETAPHV